MRRCMNAIESCHPLTNSSKKLMRTTLDVADDVLAAAKELARMENTTAGAVLSRLARQALTAPVSPIAPSERSAAGFRTIPRGGNVVTNDHVNAIREAEGI